MRLQEGRPGLAGLTRRGLLGDIPLNCPVGDLDPEFEQFATDAFRAHNGFSSDIRTIHAIVSSAMRG
jgi:hypothetical protein